MAASPTLGRTDRGGSCAKAEAPAVVAVAVTMEVEEAEAVVTPVVVMRSWRRTAAAVPELLRGNRS